VRTPCRHIIVLFVCVLFFPQQSAQSASNTQSLLQWLAWEKSSFQQSITHDKPVLLYLNAVWCKNCHIFEKNVLENTHIAQYIKDNFITIRVDADEHPDIAERYVDRGLPTFAFLLANGKVIVKGNNISAALFDKNMRLVSRLYHNDRQKIIDAIARRETNDSFNAMSPKKDGQNYKLVDDIDKLLAQDFDTQYGGFGEKDKFPLVYNLEFLLLQYYLTGKKSYLTKVVTTLKNIEAGLFDEVEGGFYRYSTTRDWGSPHYEKMLNANAELLSIYLDVYSITHQALYKEIALKTIGFVNETLLNKDKAVFYASQDAEDGAYYKLDKSGRSARAAPHVDARIFSSNNAEYASALVKAYKILNNSEYIVTADKVFHYILNNNVDNNQFIRHSSGDDRLLFEDQITMAMLGMALYEASGKKEYITQTENILERAKQLFWDNEKKGFFSSNQEQRFSEYNVDIKSKKHNALAVEIYRKLYYLKNKSVYKTIYQQILDSIPEMQGVEYISNVAVPKLAAVALKVFYPPLEIKVVKGKTEDHKKELMNEVYSHYGPLNIVSIYDPVKDKEKIKQLNFPLKDYDMAYLCSNDICIPVTAKKYDANLKIIYESILAN